MLNGYMIRVMDIPEDWQWLDNQDDINAAIEDMGFSNTDTDGSGYFGGLFVSPDGTEAYGILGIVPWLDATAYNVRIEFEGDDTGEGEDV